MIGELLETAQIFLTYNMKYGLSFSNFNCSTESLQQITCKNMHNKFTKYHALYSLKPRNKNNFLNPICS